MNRILEQFGRPAAGCMLPKVAGIVATRQWTSGTLSLAGTSDLPLNAGPPG